MVEYRNHMFHIDCTFEDSRIIAISQDGQSYQTVLSDNLTGRSHEVVLTAKQLGMMFMFNMSNDGEPEGFAEYYKELEPLLVGCPTECRPIP